MAIILYIFISYPSSYNYDTIHQAVRALSVSLKVSIRIDGDGLMSLQFLMPTGQRPEQRTYMEFIVSKLAPPGE